MTILNLSGFMFGLNHDNDALRGDLKAHWAVVMFVLASLVGYLLFCHFWAEPFRQYWSESQREGLRSIFYVLAILLMPSTNLLRFVQVRLNQTMPGGKPARSRYLLTVGVSMVLMETIGVFGLVMFMLGDGFNTLYILSAMSALGMYLYRPRLAEYESIVAALREKSAE